MTANPIKRNKSSRGVIYEAATRRGLTFLPSELAIIKEIQAIRLSQTGSRPSFMGVVREATFFYLKSLQSAEPKR